MYLYIEIYNDTIDGITALNNGVPPVADGNKEVETNKEKKRFFAYSLDSSLPNKVLTYHEYSKIWYASEQHHAVSGSIF